jgi:two-component system cell cycle response regulator
MWIRNALVSEGLFKDEDIIEADDGLDGFKKYKEHLEKLDVVLCDVQMERIDGLKFVALINDLKEKFKKEGKANYFFITNIIPVIVMTGTGMRDSKIEALTKGAKDFIFKPQMGITKEEFEQELIARVKIHLILKRALEKLSNMNLELYRMSIKDTLTGVFNRRYFMEILVSEISRSQRNGKPVALIIFDVDNFKKINDNLGHLIGDEVLKDFAKRLMRIKRRYDQVARYGGDEFVVILPETRIDGAKAFYERLIKDIKSKPLKIEGRTIEICSSAGASLYPSEKTRISEELIKNADYALLQAKKSGKSKFEFYI